MFSELIKYADFSHLVAAGLGVLIGALIKEAVARVFRRAGKIVVRGEFKVKDLGFGAGPDSVEYCAQIKLENCSDTPKSITDLRFRFKFGRRVIADMPLRKGRGMLSEDEKVRAAQGLQDLNLPAHQLVPIAVVAQRVNIVRQVMEVGDAEIERVFYESTSCYLCAVDHRTGKESEWLIDNDLERQLSALRRKYPRKVTTGIPAGTR